MKDVCPHCGEDTVTTLAIPDRKIHLHPGGNRNEEGDKIKCSCSFCGWWSEGTFSKSAPPALTHKCGYPCKDGEDCKHKPSEAYSTGPGWVWKTKPSLSPKERERLEQRLKILKKSRR